MSTQPGQQIPEGFYLEGNGDPWVHRSTGMKCTTCMWFVEKVQDVLTTQPREPRPLFGRCRKHAPTMNGYPAVFGHDWCGDHKLDENKL